MSVRIGIDLGTTNSAAAMVYDDGPHVIPREGTDIDRVFIPSEAWFKWEDGYDDIIVGIVQSHKRVVRSIKRLMGRTYDTALSERANDHFKPPLSLERRLKNDLRLVIENDDGGSREYWPHEISALILKTIKKQVEEKLRVEVDGAVITVPAYFGDSHRAATLAAARLAGIRVIEPLIDEPSAAAFAFSRIVAVPRAEPLLVVDWGGGTLDVTVLINDGCTWTQLHIDGDLNLGGEDLDRALARSVLKRKRLPETLLDDNETAFPLLKSARVTKELLSTKVSASFGCVVRDPKSLRMIQITDRLAREDFEVVAEPFVDRTLKIVQRCLDHPDVPAREIRKVLLVGGSTLIPVIRRRLGELLPDAHLHDDVDPMQAVVLGAAIYAEMQADDLLRICPYGYGVQRRDGGIAEVIPPDQDIPTPEHLPYTVKPEPETAYDGQTVFSLTLVPFTQHAHGLKNLSLGSAVRMFGRRFPPHPSGSKVECQLWLDANKILRARVRLEGTEETREMEQISLSEIGPDALLTELKDCCLDVEALLEGNTDNKGPLLQEIRTEWEQASTLLDSGEPDKRETVLHNLRGLVEQMKTSNTWTDSEEENKNRVHSWVLFYEQTMLPKYMSLLDDDERRVSVESIQRIRIMEQTGASGDELSAVLAEFDERLRKMHIGPVLIAYCCAATLGMPGQIKKELLEICDRAKQSAASGDQSALERACAELVLKTEEANKRWESWRTTRDVMIVNPDLVVK